MGALSGALQQVWSMINGLQIFVHLPLLGVDLPDAAQDFVFMMVDLANFDVIETDIIYSSMMEMPDEDYEPDDVKPQYDQP